MAYTVEIIRRNEQITSEWSGGTTTQLAIYPENSDYKERNFSWRLSSARVDLEESVFTSLPGIYRHIMVLDGEMRLIHEGHHTILLKPYEKDSFSGDWTTKSIGRVRDFNLMLNSSCKGELDAVITDKEIKIDTRDFLSDNAFNITTQGFYCAEGEIDMFLGRENKERLSMGDLILICYPSAEQCPDISLEPIDGEKAVVIRAGILHQ